MCMLIINRLGACTYSDCEDDVGIQRHHYQCALLGWREDAAIRR